MRSRSVEAAKAFLVTLATVVCDRWFSRTTHFVARTRFHVVSALRPSFVA